MNDPRYDRWDICPRCEFEAVGPTGCDNCKSPEEARGSALLTRADLQQMLAWRGWVLMRDFDTDTSAMFARHDLRFRVVLDRLPVEESRVTQRVLSCRLSDKGDTETFAYAAPFNNYLTIADAARVAARADGGDLVGHADYNKAERRLLAEIFTTNQPETKNQ